MDHLEDLAFQARALVKSGYYDARPAKVRSRPPSLREAVLGRERAIIAEIKPASPSGGVLRPDIDVSSLAKDLKNAGACGLSVLTEPKSFRGSLESLSAAGSCGLPALMKDFVVSRAQIEAAAAHGASAVLLIVTLFDRRLTELPLETAVDYAHSLGLETLAEAADDGEYRTAAASGSDILGINNRDLPTMTVDLKRTIAVLKACGKLGPTISLSGVASRLDADVLFGAGADGILVGSSLMRDRDPATMLRKIIGA
ncbi:MAG: indole-3-glycerol-phosphate synthase [Euryarchaeota archaeon]|nr:indole-3-glycerol-phosphate synthase [Euryarchaeota archaeon]